MTTPAAARRHGWALISSPIPGIERVDSAYRDLVNDLQRTEFAMTYRARNTAVPLWARTRRLAVRLAQVAMQRREEAAGRRAALREELHALAGLDLARRIGSNAERLKRLLHWVPAERWHHAERTSFTGGGRLLPHQAVEHLELPHVAFLAVTARSVDDATAELDEFVALSLEMEALDAEHLARWDPRLTPAIAAWVLFGDGPWPPADEERAVHALCSFLPLSAIRRGAYGGAPVDRLEDFPQQARLHLVEQLQRVAQRFTPLERLGLLYDADPRLTHLANAASADFLHDRQRDRRRSRLAQIIPVAEAAATARRRQRELKGTTDPRGDEEVIVSDVGMPDAIEWSDELEAWVLRQFDHTRGQRRVLSALLHGLDGPESCFRTALAAASGQSGRTVARYLKKLAREVPELRAFIAGD